MNTIPFARSLVVCVLVAWASGCATAAPGGGSAGGAAPPRARATRPEPTSTGATPAEPPPRAPEPPPRAPEPLPRTSEPPSAMVELGPGPDGRARSVPAELRVRAHLPGRDARRYLTATVALGLGTESTITGCVAAVPGACDETQREVLSAADHEAYLRAWGEVAALPRCEPLARFPGDRLFLLEAAGRRYEDPLPADPAQIESRARERCAAPARLVVWIARRMGALR